LRAGTVLRRLVSQRQLDKEPLMAPRTSSLRVLLIRESRDNSCWFCCDMEILKCFFDFGRWNKGLETGEDLVGLRRRVLGGFKVVLIHWAIVSVYPTTDPNVFPPIVLLYRDKQSAFRFRIKQARGCAFILRIRVLLNSIFGLHQFKIYKNQTYTQKLKLIRLVFFLSHLIKNL